MRLWPAIMRSLLRRLFSADQRIRLRTRLRGFKDFIRRVRFAQELQDYPGWPVVLELRQNILPSEYQQQKLHNLRQAARVLDGLMINPGEVFSFWHLVGPADAAHGFLSSRTILAGRIAQAEGGGLCQLSGILYEAALRTGCEVAERHNHSVDIYQEKERITPLGLDAAVVYPLKDLRFRNTTAAPLAISLQITEHNLQLTVRSLEKIDLAEITISRADEQSGKARLAEVLIRQGRRVHAVRNVYRLPGG